MEAVDGDEYDVSVTVDELDCFLYFSVDVVFY